MMDIYGRVGDVDRAHETFKLIHNCTVVQYGILINAYGKCNRPEMAQEIMNEMLQNQRIVPDIEVFNTLINAWAESSAPDATERAFDVLRFIKEHPRCVALNIVPNEVTFNSLLKCLSTSGIHYDNEISKDTAIQAESILNEMESFMNDPQRRLKPDAISYTMAIRACLRVNDIHRAELLMQRMEMSDTQPNTITYNIILNHCSKLHTSAAAERATQLLDYMIQMSKQSNPTMKPDLFSYSRVFTSWAGSGDPNAANRIWKLYETMLNDNIDLNMVCYTIIVMFLSKSDSITDMHRSVTILKAMEANSSPANLVRPDFWHYQAVVNGAIDIGHVEIAAQVVRQSVEAYVNGTSKKPKGIIYQNVVSEYIRYGDLETATNFLLSMKELIETHRKPIGLDIGTVNELIKAWKDSNYLEKDKHISQIENDFFPRNNAV
jgi:pentatricopeptide repeat protein